MADIKRLPINEPSHQKVTQAIRNTQEHVTSLLQGQSANTLFSINSLTTNSSPALTDFIPYYSASTAILANRKTAISGLASLINPWSAVFKPSDQSMTASTTITSDSALTFTASSATRYAFRAALHITASSGGVNVKLTTPASPTTLIVQAAHADNAGTAQVFVGSTATSLLSTSTLTSGDLIVDGFIANGATAGAVTFQWAQNVSSGTATTVLQGSWLEWKSV